MLSQGLGQIVFSLTSRLEVIRNLGSIIESLVPIDVGGTSVGLGSSSSKVGKVTIKVK